MKKQKEKQHVIDLDAWRNEISLWHILPPGTNKGTGLSLLKTHVDSVLNSQAILKSILLVGKSRMQLELTTGAFMRSLGLVNVNMADTPLIQTVYDLFVYMCGRNYDGYILTNIEYIFSSIQPHLVNVIKSQQLSPYNRLEAEHDTYYINAPIIMTTTHPKRVPTSITDRIQHVVLLEEYTVEELSLVVLQYLKWGRIDYENEDILKTIVKCGNGKLEKCFHFLTTCIAVMQADSEITLMEKHVNKAARLNRLVKMGVDADIPF